MKRKILLASLVTVTSFFCLNAQIKKGSVLLGGQVGFGTSKTKTDWSNADQSSGSFIFSPSLGRAVRDNLIVGADLRFYGSRSKYQGDVSARNFHAGVGAFIRKYLEVAKRLYLFGQGRFGVAGSWQKTENGPQGLPVKHRGYAFDLTVFPGISYAVTKGFFLETGFDNLVYCSFSHEKVTQTGSPNTSKYNSFSVGSGVGSQTSFSVGIRILL